MLLLRETSGRPEYTSMVFQLTTNIGMYLMIGCAKLSPHRPAPFIALGLSTCFDVDVGSIHLRTIPILWPQSIGSLQA